MSNAITQLEAAVLPITTLSVKDKDGKLTEYSLVLDYNALIKAEDQLKAEGRDPKRCDMTVPASWDDLSAGNLSVIVWSAMDQYHPEISLKEVRRWLAPAQRTAIFAMLVEQCFPGVTERIIEAAKEKKAALENPPQADGDKV